MTQPDHRPSVLFVCVKNGGKSQMAAALMRQLAGDAVEVYSAGTDPGDSLNEQSAQAVEERGATFAGEHPKPIDPAVLARVDRVIVTGGDARVDPLPGMVDQIESGKPTSLRSVGSRARSACGSYETTSSATCTTWRWSCSAPTPLPGRSGPEHVPPTASASWDDRALERVRHARTYPTPWSRRASEPFRRCRGAFTCGSRECRSRAPVLGLHRDEENPLCVR